MHRLSVTRGNELPRLEGAVEERTGAGANRVPRPMPGWGAGRVDWHEFMKGFAAHHAPLGTRFGLRRQPGHRTERGRAGFLSWTLVEGWAPPGVRDETTGALSTGTVAPGTPRGMLAP